MSDPSPETPTEGPAPRRVRRSSADQAAHAVPSDPNDPRVGSHVAPGSEYVTFDGDHEYQVDPETGTILTRIT